MKKSNLIKIFSALLCVVMLFVSCADNNSGKSAKASGADIVPAEAKFENYFETVYESQAPLFDTAERLDYGKIVDSNSDTIIFMKRDIDLKNNVTDTYTVYSLSKCQVLSTVKDTYDNMNSSNRLFELKLEGALLIKSLIYSLQTLTDEELHKLELAGASINEKDKYVIDIEFLTLKGDSITKYSTTDDNEADDIINSVQYNSNSQFNTITAFIGEKKAVVLSYPDYSLIGTYDLDDEFAHCFDYVTDKYGYYIANYYYTPIIQVYDLKSGKLVLNHPVYSTHNFTYNAFVLANGNIFVDVYNTLYYEEEDYNFVDKNDNHMARKSYIIDVKTGDTTRVNCDYTFNSVADINYVESVSSTLNFTNYANNVAVGYKIVDKRETKLAYVFLDNDMNVLYAYECDDIAPEAEFPAFSLLATGDVLITVNSEVARSAIYKQDGTLRCYVPSNASIIGSALLTSEGIYNFDLKPLYNFEEHNCTSVAYTETGVIVLDEEASNEEDKYYKLVIPGENSVSTSEINGEYYYANQNYIVTYNKDRDKYFVYNTKLEMVLVTAESPNLTIVDGNTFLSTEIEGEIVIYHLYKSQEATDEKGEK